MVITTYTDSTFNISNWWWAWRLTWGGPSPPWELCSRLLPCLPRCEGRPVSSAETPGHPVDCQEIKRRTGHSGAVFQQSRLNCLGRRAGERHLLATTKLRCVLLDLASKVWWTDGLVIDWSPQALRQFCKLWYYKAREGMEKEVKLWLILHHSGYFVHF